MTERPTEAQRNEMTVLFDAMVKAIDDYEAGCEALPGWSFPDGLREALEVVAQRRGGSELLVVTRPGSWEADHIVALARGADYDLGRDTVDPYATTARDEAEAAEAAERAAAAEAKP